MAKPETRLQEQGPDFRFEVIRAILEIAPEELEKLKKELESIRNIAQKERALLEAALEIDSLDSYGRRAGILNHAARFYDPQGHERGRDYLLAPDNTSFPTFEAGFLSSHPDLSMRIFGVNPVAIDLTTAIANTLDSDSCYRSRTAIGFVFDYTKRLQDVDVRILTAPEGGEAGDFPDDMYDSLFGEFNLQFPTPLNPETV